MDQNETVIPMNKAVVDIFAKESAIRYAKHDNGSLYICSGQFIMKTNQADFDVLIAEASRRGNIKTVEYTRMLDYVNKAKGTFELPDMPHEMESGNGLTLYMFADEKQYFGYNKKYVDIVSSSTNRLFVDDNTSYDTLSHNMIVKSPGGEVLGVVLPIRLHDTLYERLADILPLEIKWKTALERLRETPTNDPYIGKEFFDGKHHLIVSELKNHYGVDLYVVPRIENGKLSGYADLIEPHEMEAQIARWEASRAETEKQRLADEKQARKEAGKKAAYEDTRGFADKLTPMQKANALKELNGNFCTKHYGNLSMKQFIDAVLKGEKTLEIRKVLKNQYREMDAGAYMQSIGRNTHNEAWAKYKAVKDNPGGAGGADAEWLKNNHPFLHYRIFNDESVLPDDHFNKEYCVKIDDSSYYPVTKTAYDYGIYLMENPGAKTSQAAEKEKPPAPEPAPVKEDSKQAASPVKCSRSSPWGEVRTYDKLCPGVFMVSTEKHGGIMVAKDMTAALSPAAVKCGVKHNGYTCFGDHAKNVALRELLDKKLWAIPDNVKDKATYEENINQSIREHNPEYWRARQQGRERLNVRQAPTAPAHADR